MIHLLPRARRPRSRQAIRAASNAGNERPAAAGGMGRRLRAAVVVVLFTVPVEGAERRDIRSFDFDGYFRDKYSECIKQFGETAAPDLSVRYHDFEDDGAEEAMVVGSSCYTGTAGPDIHSVFRLDEQGKLKELPVRHQNTFKGKAVYADLVGNRNFDFEARNGLLCEVYHDGSGRERPLTLCYRLRGDEFILDRAEKGGGYRASFACDGAKSDREKAVCGTKALAEADVRMDRLYRTLLSRLPRVDREVLRAKQREWIERVDAVPAYKDYGAFLDRAYAARIGELKELTAGLDRTGQTRGGSDAPRR